MLFTAWLDLFARAGLSFSSQLTPAVRNPAATRHRGRAASAVRIRRFCGPCTIVAFGRRAKPASGHSTRHAWNWRTTGRYSPTWRPTWEPPAILWQGQCRGRAGRSATVSRTPTVAAATAFRAPSLVWRGAAAREPPATAAWDGACEAQRPPPGSSRAVSPGSPLGCAFGPDTAGYAPPRPRPR